MNRILVCGPKSFDKKQFIDSVFDENQTFPNVISDSSQAGVIIEDLTLATKYYTAKITIFIDEPNKNNVSGYRTWFEELFDPEARELRDSLQLIVLIFNTKSEYQSCKVQIDTLNKLMDSENPPQWDGEIVVVLADCVNATKEETDYQTEWLSLSEIREAARLVNWRDMEKTVRQLLIPRKNGDVDVVDTALANLRKAKSTNRGEIRDSDQSLVTSIIDSLIR